MNDIRKYEAPGALILQSNKQNESVESERSDSTPTNVYDNLPSPPPKSNDDDPYLHVDEDENLTDSDGKSWDFGAFSHNQICNRAKMKIVYSQSFLAKSLLLIFRAENVDVV